MRFASAQRVSDQRSQSSKSRAKYFPRQQRASSSFLAGTRVVPLRVTKLESKKAKVENGWAWPQFLLPNFYFLLGRQLPVARRRSFVTLLTAVNPATDPWAILQILM